MVSRFRTLTWMTAKSWRRSVPNNWLARCATCVRTEARAMRHGVGQDGLVLVRERKCRAAKACEAGTFLLGHALVTHSYMDHNIMETRGN